ncbi:MAG: tandem-95 repeat protein [Gemmataceae bacterium]
MTGSRLIRRREARVEFVNPQPAKGAALGTPDTFAYGDLETAWSPAEPDMGLQTIVLTFAQPSRAGGLLVRETSGNGFVTAFAFAERVGGALVWRDGWQETRPDPPAGSGGSGGYCGVGGESYDYDTTPRGAPGDFVRLLPYLTDYPVAAVSITVNTDLALDEWEEIDAVRLLFAQPPGLPLVPVAADDTATVPEDGDPITIDVLSNDLHAMPAYLVVTSQPAHGYAYVSDNDTPLLLGDDRIVYEPDWDYFGSDSFTYEVRDIFGLSATATVTVTVSPVNDAPTTLFVCRGAAGAGGTLALDPLAAAADPDGDALSLSIVAGPRAGTAAIDAVGRLIYTPSAGFSGVDRIGYQISDGHGGAAAGTALVQVYEAGQWAANVGADGWPSGGSGGDEPAPGPVGAPDTYEYGESGTAWTAAEADVGEQVLVVSFDTPTAATGVLVRETGGNGFVRQVVLIGEDDTEHLVWAGLDPSQPGTPFDLTVAFPQTAYAVQAVKLVIDTDHVPDEWEAVDAVRLLTGGAVGGVTLTGVSADESGGWTHTRYDAAGRPVLAETYQDGTLAQTEVYSYDPAEGFLTARLTTDVLGRQTQTTFDADGRTLSETLAYGTAQPSTTSYVYDTAGNLLSLTDPSDNITTWTYDTLGRETSMTDPLGHTVTRGYDSEGRLAWVTDRRGLRREYGYDGEGRPTSETWYAADLVSVADTITFGYDADGRLQTASNAVGGYTFSYDAAGQLASVENPFGVTLTFGYDASGNRVLVQDSFGGATTSTFDEWGQLASRTLTQPGGPTLRIDQDRDESGRVIEQRRYADAAGTRLVARSEYDYDAAGQLSDLTHTAGSGDLIAEYAWEYDAAGQLTSQTDHGVTVTYEYDSQGQLTGEDAGSGAQEYDYDESGNRDSAGYVVGPGNRLLSDGVWDYSYDEEGNVAGKDRLSDGLTWSYEWDHRNQLVAAEERDAEGDLLLRAKFGYDAFGNRLEKAVDVDGDGVWDSVQRYVLDGWNPAKADPVGNENFDVLLDLDGANQLQTRYLRGDVVDEVFARVEESQTGRPAFWYLADQLGSVRDVIDESGDIRDSVRHDGFGNVVTETDPGYRGRYGWTGREHDAETGLQYNRARYYDPQTGRWLSQDPLGFAAGDIDLYRYSRNTPTKTTDPSGLAPATPGKKFFGYECAIVQPNGEVIPRPYPIRMRPALTLQVSKSHGNFYAPIQWDLHDKAGPLGGVIVQHVTAKFNYYDSEGVRIGGGQEWNYLEMWKVAPNSTTAVTIKFRTVDDIYEAPEGINRLVKTDDIFAFRGNSNPSVASGIVIYSGIALYFPNQKSDDFQDVYNLAPYGKRGHVRYAGLLPSREANGKILNKLYSEKGYRATPHVVVATWGWDTENPSFVLSNAMGKPKEVVKSLQNAARTRTVIGLDKQQWIDISNYADPASAEGSWHFLGNDTVQQLLPHALPAQVVPNATQQGVYHPGA